jgi:aromatic aminotransferase
MSASISNRIQRAERPYIEDVLDYYSAVPNLTKLALGSSHWTVPPCALSDIAALSAEVGTHKYNSILGLEPLRRAIRTQLLRESNGTFPAANEHVIVTAGANQAMVNVALTLCDSGDRAIMLEPYYFSHSLALQLAGVDIHRCPFEPTSWLPNWDKLEHDLQTLKPKVVSFFFFGVYSKYVVMWLFFLTGCSHQSKQPFGSGVGC